MPIMPHATNTHEEEDAQFADALERLADGSGPNAIDLNSLWIPSEKADDAIDYESDDSLAEDDEEKGAGPTVSSAQDGRADPSSPDDLINFMEDGYQELPELTSGSGEHDGDDLDDLFGGGPSSPVGFHAAHDAETGPAVKSADPDFNIDDLFGDATGDVPEDTFSIERNPVIDTRAVAKSIEIPPPEPAMSKEEQLQRELFAMSSRTAFMGSDYPPAPPENQEELLASLWPKFERNTVPKFMDLLPPKTAHWLGKRPLKTPKPLQPTKIGLELAVDHEKLFRLPNGSCKRSHDEMDHGVIIIPPLTSASDADEDNAMEIESDYENEPVGGVTWQDLQILCQDWNMHTKEFSLENICTDPIDVPLSPLYYDDDGEEDDIFRDIDYNRQVKVSNLPPRSSKRLTASRDKKSRQQMLRLLPFHNGPSPCSEIWSLRLQKLRRTSH